jgi:anti-sigma regulatory factor (Ser/Thr protein kinase)
MPSECPADVTRGSNRWSLPAVAESAPEARDAIRAIAARHGADTELQDAMALCVTEAISNAVVHAYRDRAPGRVQITVTASERSLCVYIQDDGSGFAPRVDSPGLGLGMPLMISLADELEIRSPTGTGTEVVLRFALTASPAPTPGRSPSTRSTASRLAPRGAREPAAARRADRFATVLPSPSGAERAPFDAGPPRAASAASRR